MKSRLHNPKQRFLKDIVAKGTTTKSEVVDTLKQVKEIDHTKRPWFWLRNGKYFDFNHGTVHAQEGETQEQAEERFFSLQPYKTEEEIKELERNGAFPIIMTVTGWE